MERKVHRKIFFYGDSFENFYSKQSPGVRRKIDWTLQLIAVQARVPAKYLKHIESSDGLYEIRVEYEGNIFRIFCFFDRGDLIILVNGFQKKTDKTPRQEIQLAQKLKNQYFNEKEKH